ncbi:MAG TPA: hypothetical protein VMU57_20405 [Edaphobacter sp.]|uniref:hypothetical protein n=1 Tax=Edaphobacter sp. TaxID=1934404 RepID=UPI002C597291|nr:hypothetical protein [Edaphobacter sp.]HUZ97274.1 hypothetical protein [Edaphobacter sp.]
MKKVLCTLLSGILLGTLASPALLAQASDIPSAAAAPSSTQIAQPSPQTQEQRGRQLMDEMVTALGGDAWLHRRDMQFHGQIATFFQGRPNGMVVEFDAWQQFPGANQQQAERIGFLTDKSMIFPGKKIDVVQIWTGGEGYEVTFKGKTTLPKDQVEDYYRRQAHSIEAVVRTWLKAPGVMVLYDGTSMVERRMADQVTILSANNDAVTIDLDATTHLPLRRTFQWRNTTFKDHDEDVEEYDDYHTMQGLPTALTVTRYHNGDMANQRFLTNVQYNTGLPHELFNPDHLLKKK